jgi:glycosyltransferase involved in cell wall biosynthesis
LRSELGIDPSAKVGLFLGTLYKHKQIPLLLEAGARVHEHEPQFALIVAGDGPERGLVESAARGNPWLHAVGPAIGAAKTQVLAVSDLMLIPGRVGLAVVDAFAAGLPVITRASADHAPEIAYLQHGRNGLVVEDQDPSSYAREVALLLADPARLEQMQAQAQAHGRLHDLQDMVDRFAEGVRGALSAHEPQGRR